MTDTWRKSCVTGDANKASKKKNMMLRSQFAAFPKLAQASACTISPLGPGSALCSGEPETPTPPSSPSMPGKRLVLGEYHWLKSYQDPSQLSKWNKRINGAWFFIPDSQSHRMSWKLNWKKRPKFRLVYNKLGHRTPSREHLAPVPPWFSGHHAKSHGEKNPKTSRQRVHLPKNLQFQGFYSEQTSQPQRALLKWQVGTCPDNT